MIYWSREGMNWLVDGVHWSPCFKSVDNKIIFEDEYLLYEEMWSKPKKKKKKKKIHMDGQSAIQGQDEPQAREEYVSLVQRTYVQCNDGIIQPAVQSYSHYIHILY